METEPIILEIESNVEPKSLIENDSQNPVPKIKQESDKNDPSSSDQKKQSTSDNLQNSDLQVLIGKIFDMVSCLGKKTVTVQQTVRELTDLAMAIDSDELCTTETLTPEGSGHNKKHFVKTMLNVSGALGAGDATASETIQKLTSLATWLASPPPKKATETETKSSKGKNLDQAKPSGSEPTDAKSPKDKDQDPAKPSGPEPNDADKTKRKEKKKPTERGAEDSEVKVTSEGSGKDASLASGGNEKKNGEEDAKPATQDKEGVKLALLGKTGAPDPGVAGAAGAVPIASGDTDTDPKTGQKVPGQQGQHSSEKRPDVISLNFTQPETRPPTNQTPRGGETDHTREIGNLNLAQLRTQFTGQPTPGNGEIGNHHNFTYLHASQPQTQFPGQHTSQIHETANQHDPKYRDVSYPQNQFSGQPGHPAVQIAEMGKHLELGYRNVPQTQAQFLGQPTPQIGEMINHPGLEYRNVPQTQTQFLGQPTPQIGEPGSHLEFAYRNAPQTQTQFSGQPAPQTGEPGSHLEFAYRNAPQTQTQFSGQPTPQIGEPGSHLEFAYRNAPQQQPQFSRQQFSQATEGYIDSEFGAYAGAKSHNLAQPQQTKHAGELGCVAGYGRHHSTKAQDRPPFPTQQPPQGYANVRVMETNLSVTNTSGGTTGPASHQSQGPADGHNPFADSGRQTYLSPRKPNRQNSKLPGSYDQGEFSDSSGSFFSSESEWESIRETERGPNDQDRLNNRGGHDTGRSRHERPERHKCGRVDTCQEESSEEDTRRERPRRKGSHRDKPNRKHVHLRRPHGEESNQKYARREGPHREGYRRDGSYSREPRAEEFNRRKTFQSRLDNPQTKTAHAEDLQTKTSKKLPRSWTDYFLSASS